MHDDEDLPLYCGHRVAVVVPAYNVEPLIGNTLKGIPDFICRVYVVNDCSKDRTQEVIDYYAAHDASIVPIRHDVNKGVGAAIVTGYKRALADDMDIVVVMAGDDQMDPAFLPDLLDPIVAKKCDYTMGNRLISPNYRKGMSTWRFIGNTTLTMLTKIASGYWQMMDPQNGYTAISKRALERISLDDVYPRYRVLQRPAREAQCHRLPGHQRPAPGPVREREVRDQVRHVYLQGVLAPAPRLPLAAEDEVSCPEFPPACLLLYSRCYPRGSRCRWRALLAVPQTGGAPGPLRPGTAFTDCVRVRVTDALLCDVL